MLSRELQKDIIENLKEAGCDEKTISELVNKNETELTEAYKSLLEKQRKRFLNKLHSDQKQIDRFDYLLYMLKKQR